MMLQWLRSFTLLFFLFTINSSSDAQTTNLAHPLDPLTKEEINLASQILKDGGKATANTRFPSIVLNEPPKAEVLNFKPGDAFRREAFVVTYEYDSNKTCESVVDLKSKTIKSWREMPGVQP